MGSLVAIDPGKVTGWAHFRDGQLSEAGTTYPDLIRLLPSIGAGVVVIEKPQIYPLGKGKGDPNDILDLGILVGRIYQWYASKDDELGSLQIRLVTPRRWKGTVPKVVHHRRVMAALSGTELDVLPNKLDHNMLDAVGLGLWQLERIS